MPDSPLFGVAMLEGGSDYPTPDATADSKQINDMFKYAEQFWGVKPVTSGALPGAPKVQQLVVETDTGKAKYWDGVSWVVLAEPASASKGTTAARNIAYPTPGSAAARVALANTVPLWYNTDKGWEEQYYAQYDDAGVGAGTPVRAAHGWAPRHDVARVQLTKFTAAVNGTGTVTKKGGKVEFATAQGVLIDNCFTADFPRYELELTCSVVSTATALEMRFRSGGTTNSTANYAYNFREITPGAAESGAGPVTEMIISRAFTGGFTLRSVIDAPADAARKTMMLNHMMDSDTKTRIGGSQYNATAAFDGFWLDLTGTGTFTGEFRLYGIPG